MLSSTLLHLCGAISDVEFRVIASALPSHRGFLLHITQNTQNPALAVSNQ